MVRPARARPVLARPLFTRLVVLLFCLPILWPAFAAAGEPEACPGMGDAVATPSGGELTVTFSGVSTLMFSDDHDRILVDGFFSRPGLLDSIVRLRSDRAQVRAGLGDSPLPLRAVLTAHAHHDHALDTATSHARRRKRSWSARLRSSA